MDLNSNSILGNLGQERGRAFRTQVIVHKIVKTNKIAEDTTDLQHIPFEICKTLEISGDGPTSGRIPGLLGHGSKI
jgi:hypothetical protein